MPREARKDRRIGGLAFPGQGKRSEQMDIDTEQLAKNAPLLKGADGHQRCAHRAHGM